MPNVISEQSIIITRSELDNGIKDVKEWEIYRKKIGGAYALIDTYNLVSEGHYVLPDYSIEGSVGEYNFSYPTQIPVSIPGDQYQYKIISNDRIDVAIERESIVYTVISENLSNNFSIGVDIGVKI